MKRDEITSHINHNDFSLVTPRTGSCQSLQIQKFQMILSLIQELSSMKGEQLCLDSVHFHDKECSNLIV